MSAGQVVFLDQRSSSGDAALTTTYTDDYIIRGRGLNIQRRFASIAAAATYKLVFDFSAISATKMIFMLPLAFSATGGPVYIKTYKLTTYTGGTAIPLINLNNFSEYTALTVFKHGIASTDVAGDDLREYELGATGNPQQVNRAGSATGASPVIFKGGQKLCIEIVNNYSAAINLTLGAVLYELP